MLVAGFKPVGGVTRSGSIPPSRRQQVCRRTHGLVGYDVASTRRRSSVRIRVGVHLQTTRGGDRTHNLRLREPTRFHCATRARRSQKSGPWSCWGSNPGPSPYQSDALPTELHDRCRGRRTQAVKGVDPKSTGLCPRRFESCRLRLFRKHTKTSPTRIRTAVAGFRVLSANHYTMGEPLGRLAQW